jgi:RsmE family RNA methyltransferase
MNLIMLDCTSNKQKLLRGDRRCEHIRQVLDPVPDGRLFVGVPNGPLARALVSIDAQGDVVLEVDWENPFRARPHAYPLELLVGLCRPQTCRKILKEAASLGIKQLRFFGARHGERSYADSSLWKDGEWQRCLMEGVEQSFDTHVPEVTLHGDLLEAVAASSAGAEPGERANWALDPYEGTVALGVGLSGCKAGHCVCALGPERGWSAAERTLLRDSGFALAHLGQKVMRTETAVCAVASAAASHLGWWKPWNG